VDIVISLLIGTVLLFNTNAYKALESGVDYATFTISFVAFTISFIALAILFVSYRSSVVIRRVSAASFIA
jgi:hypothetical protein